MGMEKGCSILSINNDVAGVSPKGASKDNFGLLVAVSGVVVNLVI